MTLLNRIKQCVILIILVKWWFRSVQSEMSGAMTGPPKHRGFFHKQTGRNKTIPVCERPGEEMIVIDVDGTLWPYQIDTDPIFQDPFTIHSDNGLVMVGDKEIEPYSEAEATLLELVEKGYVLAAISLTNSTYKTMEVLHAFGLTNYFKHMEMGPGTCKLDLITEVCSRTGLSLEDVMCFVKDSDEVTQSLVWHRVIVYCVKRGLNKEVAREGLYVFEIRPRKDKRQNVDTDKIEQSNKNKCRPAYELDGTEIEGFDYNATKIEYS